MHDEAHGYQAVDDVLGLRLFGAFLHDYEHGEWIWISLSFQYSEMAGVEARRLKVNEIQARDAAEIADVACSNGVAEFERAGSDDEIGHWNRDPVCGLLRADPGDDFGGRFGDGMDGNRGFQLVKEQSATLAHLRRVSPIDPVADLGDSHRRQHDWEFHESFFGHFRWFRRQSACGARRRSAAISTLESSTIPRTADSMAPGAP